MAAPKLISPQESIRLSERFSIESAPVGRGTWGVVNFGYDNELAQDVSIKRLAPSELARMQMIERNLSTRDIMRKDAAGLRAAAHVLPRELHYTDDGEPFLVMPRVDGTLVDLLNEAKQNPHVAHEFRFPSLFEDKFQYNHNHPSEPETITATQRPFPTGLSFATAIDYLRQIATGMNELHVEYGRIYGDLKLENVVFQRRNHGPAKLLLTDLGTSTVFDPQHTDIRSNMGCVYTRHPTLWLEGVHPTLATDNYALASMATLLFDGKFLRQDTIDELLKHGGVDAVRKHMERFYQAHRYGDDRVHVTEFTHENQNDLEHELARTAVPARIQTWIRNTASSSSSVGYALQRLDAAIETQTRQDAARAATKSYAFSIGRVIAMTAAIAATLFGAMGGCFGAYRYTTKNILAAHAEFEPQIERALPENSLARFVFEPMTYDTTGLVKPDGYHSFTELLKLDKENAPSLLTTLTSLWIATANDLGVTDLTGDFSTLSQRYNVLTGASADYRSLVRQDRDGKQVFANSFLREVLKHELAVHTLDEKGLRIAFEDAAAGAYLNRSTLWEAQRASGSTHFSDYVRARRADGSYVIPEAGRKFLKLYVARARGILPQAAAHE